MKHFFRSCLVVLCSVSVWGEVQLASIFSDHMVLQRDQRVPVWGSAAAGEEVTVRFADQVHVAIADATGTWRVDFDPMAVSASPRELQVASAKHSITLSGILVGDVWLCSGQSNMDYSMKMLKLSQSEIDATTNYPTLRLFVVQRKTNPTTCDTSVEGSWTLATPECVENFSGTATYFGRALARDLEVPIGLIESAWGGTPVESWTSRAAHENIPFMTDRLLNADQGLKNYTPEKAQAALEKQLALWKAKKSEGKPAGRKPKLWNPYTSPWHVNSLYNGMIAPLVPTAIRGVIWYQGEANARNHLEYHELFSTMIRDWRSAWRQGDFPFLFVQLANFKAEQVDPVEEGNGWVGVCEAQSQTLTLPATGMAVISDVGEANDIHPKDKKTVGERLALAARAKAYGQELVYSGPTFRGLDIQGGKAVVRFDHIGSGLVAQGTALAGFAVAGADQVWYWADAIIDEDTVVVSAMEVPDPVAVRYNWAQNPIGNLYNKEGLPASLFRSDNW